MKASVAIGTTPSPFDADATFCLGCGYMLRKLGAGDLPGYRRDGTDHLAAGDRPENGIRAAGVAAVYMEPVRASLFGWLGSDGGLGPGGWVGATMIIGAAIGSQ